MQEHPNVTLVRDMFAAMDRGDMQWIDDHTSDDIVWHTGGNSKAALSAVARTPCGSRWRRCRTPER